MAPGAPIVISFYAGDTYYHRAAQQLREDCDRLGVPHDIVELSVAPSDDWISLCRRKVPFILSRLQQHGRPVLWLDVDCRLLKTPPTVTEHVDAAFFVRGFRYLRDVDPLALSRFWQPSILLFNHTPRSQAFLELMGSLERQSSLVATDDYFLQEAWLQHQQALSVLALRPELVSHRLPAPEEALFLFGRSGQVSAHRSRAAQHEPAVFNPARQKAVFSRAGGDAGKQKRPEEALVFLQQALRCDPNDRELALRVARLMHRLDKQGDAIALLESLPSGGSDTLSRFRLDLALEAGRPDEAQTLANALIDADVPEDKDWARSRLLRIGLEQRAQKLRLKPAQRPALWWMESPYPGNFGDILNPYIVEKLSGLPPRFVPKNKGMLAIGSIIKFAVEGTPVWGSGTPRMSDRLNPKADYRAVRGPLTRQLVLESGGTCPEVYGDAAWFLPRLYQPKPPTRRYRLGLIRHFANDADISVGEGVKLISVLRAGYEGIEQFVDELHECDCILTTSLHGLIVSHAYGIPARWCEVPDSPEGLPGDGTKFHDYMLSVGLEPEAALPLPCGTVVGLDRVAEAHRLPNKQIDLDALAAAAPFPVKLPPPATP